MTAITFHNGHVLFDGGWHDGGRLEGADEQITAYKLPIVDGDAIDLGGGYIVPGFIDTQVNGGGVLFNDHLNADGIAQIGAAHARFGTTAFLPTLISATIENVACALDAVDDAIERGVPGVIGIHIEGPFLNPKRKGIHDASRFRALDAAALELLTRPRRGVVMVTLAPERTDSAAIRTLAEAGVIVSIGHSDATYLQTREAIEAGARGVTHLYNAMSPLHHREPGVVGAALEDRTLYCGLIVDGAHVHPAALRIALAARPLDRFMLVTDAMPTVGSADESFMLNGEQITVQDGICINPQGTLAGSNLDMASAVRNTRDLGVSLKQVLAMASEYPAAFLGLSDHFGRLAPGYRADFVWLDADLKVLGTWIGGHRVF